MLKWLTQVLQFIHENEPMERMERISPGAGVAGEGVLLRGMSGPVGSASGVR